MITDKEINKEIFTQIFDVNKKLTIFDVGTYDGSDSLEFSKLFPNANIYSFDADPRSIQLFKKIIGRNEKITLSTAALTNIDGYVDWYSSDSKTRRHHKFQDFWSASSSIKKPSNHLNIFKDITFKKDKKVKSCRLDTWLLDKEEIELIDIMWVDVNGGENEFLEGALNTIKNKVKYLYIEFNAVGDKELYEGCPNRHKIINKLDNFQLKGVYNYMGNFGNIFLKNKILEDK